MENSIMVIRDLIKMSEEELFYRGYHKAAEKGWQQQYLRMENVPEDWRNTVLDAEKYYSRETEEMFMKPDRNVGIQKHLRYLPCFTHSHTFFEIAYVLFGSCGQTIENQLLNLSEGDFCMIAPGVRHGIEIMDDDTILLNILIRRDTFVDIFYGALRNKSHISTFFNSSIYRKNQVRYLNFHTHGDTNIRDWILQMCLENMVVDEYSDRLITSLLINCFNMLTRKFSHNVDMMSQDPLTMEYQETILNYISNHYSTASIRELAGLLGFSETYASKLIRQITGSTFSEILNNIRMQQSEYLLTQTRLSVEDISVRLGYQNPESYIRAFRKSRGMTPARYRKAEGCMI